MLFFNFAFLLNVASLYPSSIAASNVVAFACLMPFVFNKDS